MSCARLPIIEIAINRVGSARKLAKVLDERSHSVVLRWTRVPLEHVRTIAEITGRRPDQVRPDWNALRKMMLAD